VTDNKNMQLNLVYNIVYDSEYVTDVMLELLLQMPELFRIMAFNGIKHLVTESICNPEVPLVSVDYHRKFYEIIGKIEKPSDTKKKKKARTEQQRLADQLRLKVQKVIRGDYSDKGFMRELGCSGEEFKKHIESQFDGTMNWGNYGFSTWHIDHISPLCSFDLTKSDHISIVCNYENLRPLSAIENVEKGKKDGKLSIRKDLK
jgi:hypothetical protein